MAKRIHHLGMTISAQEHEAFHRSAPTLSEKQHAALMKRMGITKEQDAEWHRTHMTLAEARVQGLKHLEASAISASFLAWCVKQGWLVQQGREYFATKDGLRELHERFGMDV